jgi:hypothetical protein
MWHHPQPVLYRHQHHPIRCAAITTTTTTKDIASRRLGIVYNMPKTLPS